MIFLGANQNGTSVSHNGQDRASTNSSGISSLKSQIAKSFRLSSSSTSVTSNNASKSPPDNNVEQATECSVKENSNSWKYVEITYTKKQCVWYDIWPLNDYFTVFYIKNDFEWTPNENQLQTKLFG